MKTRHIFKCGCEAMETSSGKRYLFQCVDHCASDEHGNWKDGEHHESLPNQSEMEFSKCAKLAGWEIFHTGWPDFLMIHPDKGICVVEVKQAAHHNLRENQIKVMNILKRAGLKCFKWSPDKGFQKIDDHLSLNKRQMRRKAWLQNKKLL